MAFGPLGPIRSLGVQNLEGSRPTDLGGASWVAASVTPDMSSEDPALQPPVLEPWWDGDGEGHPHPGMLETDRSVTQSRRNASIHSLSTTEVGLIKFSYNTLEITVFTFVHQPNTTRLLA